MHVTFPKMNNEIIGNWLREQREEHGFSIKELAYGLRITTEKWRMMEKGESPITLRAFTKFFLLLGMEEVEFFGVLLKNKSKEEHSSFNEMGNQVKKWRNVTGLSSRALGEKIGKSHAAVHNLENGSKRLSVTTLIQLDEVLGKEGELFNSYFQIAFLEEVKQIKNQVQILIGKERIVIPSAMPDLTSRKTYWQQKLASILWCMTEKGRATAQDIALLMECDYQSLISTFLRLEEVHLIESFKVNLLGPIKLYRLSEMGRIFCEEMGWAVNKSDLDVMFDGHQGREQLRHTAAVLFFAYKARLQGHSVILLPEISIQKSKYQPDILISNGTDKIYFEVELKARNKTDKWKYQMALQGFVAFFTLSALQRVQIENQIMKSGIENIYSVDIESHFKS